MRLLIPLALLASATLCAPAALAEEPLSTDVVVRDAQKRSRLAALQEQNKASVSQANAQQAYNLKLIAWRESVDDVRLRRQIVGVAGLVVGAGEGIAGALLISNADDRELAANGPKKTGFVLVGAGVLTVAYAVYSLLAIPNADDLLAEQGQTASSRDFTLRF